VGAEESKDKNAGKIEARAISTPNLLRSLAQGLTWLGLRLAVALANVERLSSIVWLFYSSREQLGTTVLHWGSGSEETVASAIPAKGGA
jgi:hypothetical protein